MKERLSKEESGGMETEASKKGQHGRNDDSVPHRTDFIKRNIEVNV